MNRDIKLSNIKGILILLVVFGHLISNYQTYFKDIYLFIYSFHMPLFVLLSGYFSKRVTFKKVINFVLILAIFQPLYRGFMVLINEMRTFRLNADVPFYHLWFLFASIVWYMIAIGINKLQPKRKHKIILLILFFAIGLTARFIAEPFEDLVQSNGLRFKGTSFSYMRILSYLPFFFIGKFLTKEHMAKLYNTLSGFKLIPVILLASMYLCIRYLDPHNAGQVFKGRFGIAVMEGSLQYRIIYILMGYIIALLMCFIMLNIVSNKKSIITRIGDRTLPIYLFHVFIVNIIKKIVVLRNLHPLILLPILVMLSVLITVLLGSDKFIKFTYYLCNPLEFIIMVRNKVFKLNKRVETNI